MRLFGGISLDDGGIYSSVRGMHLQTSILHITNDNIAGFNKVGYQRKAPIVSSFAEFIGTHALSENKDEEVGRIKITKRPLDLALGTQGYFQVETKHGIKLTRDGRFKIDKEGNLINIHGDAVLSRDGAKIKLSKIPKTLDEIKINPDGSIIQFDPDTFNHIKVANLSVVSTEGSIPEQINIKQGYLEESNVSLQQEVMSLVPVKRNFSANRELFLIQNDVLSKMLQQLGRA